MVCLVVSSTNAELLLPPGRRLSSHLESAEAISVVVPSRKREDHVFFQYILLSPFVSVTDRAEAATVSIMTSDVVSRMVSTLYGSTLL